ncbi:hypothetical protein EB001_21435 [bacterium]|nr:hypothetical protein [bacterium]
MAQFRIDSHQYLPQEKTLFEVVMLADQYGNQVGPANPTGTAVDAFGRARVSTPLTLFDSSHRYADNGLWVTSNTSSNSTVTFNENAGLMNLVVTTANNAEIIRETTKVFSYQPGKSLQILQTFVMEPKANVRQRVGYYGANNGIYLEVSGNTAYFVERSLSSGTVQETRVAQSSWNKDTLLGAVASSPSGITLDLTKAQIMFVDVEWLGLGTVRCGFVIDGRLIHCHSFNHANYITSTYMTTASLPLRYEIKNTGVTASNTTLKQVCSSVISEGGYELRGTQQSIGLGANSAVNLAAAGTFYPIISIQLKSARQDAIVILTALSILGIGNNARFRYKIINNPTLTNASWTSAGSDTSVEYDTSATAVTGGRTLASGYLAATTQSATTIDALKEALFKFQLERNALTGVSYPLTLAIESAVANDDVLATLDWEEITR